MRLFFSPPPSGVWKKQIEDGCYDSSTARWNTRTRRWENEIVMKRRTLLSLLPSGVDGRGNMWGTKWDGRWRVYGGSWMGTGRLE